MNARQLASGSHFGQSTGYTGCVFVFVFVFTASWRCQGGRRELPAVDLAAVPGVEYQHEELALVDGVREGERPDAPSPAVIACVIRRSAHTHTKCPG
jgi:hypothetical protein